MAPNLIFVLSTGLRQKNFLDEKMLVITIVVSRTSSMKKKQEFVNTKDLVM